MFYNNYHYNESQIHSFLSFAFTLSSHSFHLFAQFLLPRVQTHSLSTSSFGNLSFLCSALGSPLHFFLIRASFSPPLCSALVSGGLRVDLVRQMVWEWQRDRKARRRGGGKRGNRQPYLVSREAGPVKSIWSSVIHFPAPQETGIKS